MTTTAKRPSTARKVTRSTEAKREDELERGIKITLEGDVYEIRLADITSNLAREFRKAAGYGVQRLMSEIVSDPDLDSIASFVWLARRIGGEALDLDDVVVSYAQILGGDFDVSLPGDRDPEETDSPEA